MNIYFYLWLAMTICAAILIYLNRQKSAIIKGYEEKVKKTDQYQTTIDDYQKELGKQRKENAVLSKLSAENTPMKSLADYREKVLLLSEQAEDMFGLYINKVIMTRDVSLFGNSWKIDMEINTTDRQQKQHHDADTIE